MALTPHQIPPVAIGPGAAPHLKAQLLGLLEAIAWRDVLTGSPTVLLKPNLGWDLFVPGAVTNAAVLRAAVELLVEDGREVIIVEADQVLVDIEVAARHAGIPQLTTHPQVSWHNLSRHPFVGHGATGGVLDGVKLPEILGRYPLITLPVMKTHAKTLVSGALKNQWGLLPIDRHNLHPHLDVALSELHALCPPALCIMDATIALEGNGPKSGTPRRVDHLLVSTSAPCLDWVAADLMGFDPATIPHLVNAAPEGLRAVRDIPLMGARPRLRPFMPPSHNLVSWVEERLRASPLRPYIFEGPVFNACCRGARGWYHLWYNLGPGRRLRKAGG